MRTAAGFNANHPVGRQRLHADKSFGVFAGVDVIGDDRDRVGVAHRLAELVGQGRLSGANRTANTDAQGAGL